MILCVCFPKERVVYPKNLFFLPFQQKWTQNPLRLPTHIKSV